MTWKKIKEFLKPDWKRLLITVILCGIIYGLLYCFSVGGECLSQTAVNLVLSGPQAFFESLFDLFLTLNNPIAEKISVIVISYLLSCSIIYLFDKYKKK